jgi:hypothetical protein
LHHTGLEFDSGATSAHDLVDEAALAAVVDEKQA